MKRAARATPPAGLDVALFPGAVADLGLGSRLIATISWRQESVRLFGRTHPQPRLIAWYGDPDAAYRYAGLSLAPLAWTQDLAALRDRASTLCAAPFNSVLLNLYRDHADRMGAHADDEPELGPEPVIGAFSFGAERVLYFRHRRDRSRGTYRLTLPDRSLLVMRGTTQQDWKHGIDRQRTPCGPRVSATFRWIFPAPARRTAPTRGQ